MRPLMCAAKQRRGAATLSSKSLTNFFIFQSIFGFVTALHDRDSFVPIFLHFLSFFTVKIVRLRWYSNEILDCD